MTAASLIHPENLTVILSHPLHPDNVGSVARSMKNTGFKHLRLVTETPLDRKAWVTAVHSREILDTMGRFPTTASAVADLDVVFAAVARKRKNFPAVTLKAAVAEIGRLSRGARIGLLFGNERTGLLSEELRHSNHRFTIPMAGTQPSYNLASAVLITLFMLFTHSPMQPVASSSDRPLPRSQQEACIRLILDKLRDRRFIHAGNEVHITERIHDLLGRLVMSRRDRDLILAVFDKGLDER